MIGRSCLLRDHVPPGGRKTVTNGRARLTISIGGDDGIFGGARKLGSHRAEAWCAIAYEHTRGVTDRVRGVYRIELFRFCEEGLPLISDGKSLNLPSR